MRALCYQTRAAGSLLLWSSIVVSAMRALSRADREALILRVAGELAFDEIAVVMHTSPAAVKMRMSRARRKLAALLAETAPGTTNTHSVP